MSVMTRSEAVHWASSLRAEGKTVVFTNGVFDLLHPGHVRYLADARAQGDALIVAVNSDRSVRAIKGPARPITAEQERAEVLSALAVVDAVVIFDEDDPHAIISAIQPDVLVKGADWAADRDRRPRRRRSARRPRGPHPVRAGVLDNGYDREDPARPLTLLRRIFSRLSAFGFRLSAARRVPPEAAGRQPPAASLKCPRPSPSRRCSRA